MFERYAEIIPDFDAFQAALQRPRDVYLRVNRLRIDPQDFARRARAWGHELEAVPWFPSAFKASPELMKTRATLEYFLGMYYIQGAPSMIPPLALDPRPGERVLDMCAAPGSKTTQICEMMGNEGLVVANDIYIDRLKILKGHVERLGITCAILTRRHGDSFPGGIPFHKVLVDAPCSGEGTMRGGGEHGRGRKRRRDEDKAATLLRMGPKGPRAEVVEEVARPAPGPGFAPAGGQRRSSPHEDARALDDSDGLHPADGPGTFGGPGGAAPPPPPPPGGDDEAADGPREYTQADMERLYTLQGAILRRAANLCVPGGTIVYSTCTYSPLENECIVDDLLRARDDIELVDIDLDVPAEPGLTEWEGRKFKSSMRKCLRFYPHRLNSWGFFVAKLRRRPRSERSPFQGAEDARFQGIIAPVEKAAEARAVAQHYFEERFGIDAATFDPYTVHDFGPSMWLASKAMPHPMRLAGFEAQNPGLRLLRHLRGKDGSYEKPTSHALQMLGKGATKMAADLREDEVFPFLEGAVIRRKFPGLDKGYAIARFGEHVLGCALITADGLVSQIPEAHGMTVKSSLFLAPKAGAQRGG